VISMNLSDSTPPVALKASGIVKWFGANRILDGVDLTVARGETVCVLGPSGSGKSTLLRCLNWLSPPDEGAIWIGDQRIGLRENPNGATSPRPEREIRAQRSRIGMVFQSFNLWPHMTVLENVALALPPEDTAALRKRLSDTADAYGLDLNLKRHVYDLSMGERQRIEVFVVDATVEHAISQGQWDIICMHGVGGEHLAIETESLVALCEYLYAQRERILTDTVVSIGDFIVDRRKVLLYLPALVLIH